MQGKTLQIEHLGIVAQVMKDIKLIDRIDSLIPMPNADVTLGQRVGAMILNCLGFVNRTLYLTPRFFEKRPVEKLLGENVSAEKLNDDCLGRALDKIHEFGETRFFSGVSLGIANDLDLIGPNFQLDSTSFSLHGNYGSQEQDSKEDSSNLVTITHGFSKDHRPDLKQIMMALVTTGASDFPLIMLPQSGNASDKSEFQKIVQQQVKDLQSQFQLPDMVWAADSALYNQKWLETQKSLNIHWVTRVPETISEAKELIVEASKIKEDEWIKGKEGCRFLDRVSQYGGVEQRFIVVFSAQAQKRELETFTRNLDKQRAELARKIKKLSSDYFACATDAKKALEKLMDKETYFEECQVEVVEVEKHTSPGRPKKEAQKSSLGFQISCNIADNLTSIQAKQSSKGVFILATNHMENAAESILMAYKGLQGTERGFRFLKDSQFMMDQFYLETSSRISALLTIMTLSLMVYTLAQWKLRQACQAKGETLPNQVGKSIANITAKLCFTYFSGISIVRVMNESGKILQEFMENLSDLQRKILRLLGPPYESMYAV